MKIMLLVSVYYVAGLFVLDGLERVAPGGRRLGRGAKAAAAWLWPLFAGWVLLQLALWLPMFVIERVGEWMNPKTRPRPGKLYPRNAPCPCGSGLKHKKCCLR